MKLSEQPRRFLRDAIGTLKGSDKLKALACDCAETSSLKVASRRQKIAESPTRSHVNMWAGALKVPRPELAENPK